VPLVALAGEDLLAREPVALRWPGGKNDRKRYDATDRTFTLSCNDLALFALGAPGVPRYAFAITVEQTPWTGNVGLFFGYMESNEGEPVQRYQALELMVAPRTPESGQLWRLDWKSISHKGPPGKQTQINSVLDGSPTFRLAPREHRLEVTIGPGGPESVALDDKPMAWQPRAALKKLAPLPVGARFGVYVNNGHGVFREARFSPHEEPR
jgi:hypothetical protein